MKTAAATAMLCLMVPTGAIAEPRMLDNIELDAISAAGVAVDVASAASAKGDVTNTSTDADTVVSGNGGLEVGIGLTVGQAVACCRERGADVDVASAVHGQGNLVFEMTTSSKNDSGSWVVGFSMGFVLAISFPDPATQQRQLVGDAMTSLANQLASANDLYIR